MLTSYDLKIKCELLMKRVLITRKIPPIAKEILQTQCAVDVHLEQRPMSLDELGRAVQEYDGILSMFSDPFDRTLLAKASRLKAVSNYAIGLDNIDLAAAKERGIAVRNLQDVVTESTAELTFALLLSFVRRIPEASSHVREGKWTAWHPDLFLGEELFGKRLGIVGFGRTGRAVAKRAVGFGLKILIYHYKPLVFTDDEKKVYTQVSLDELLKESDYICLHLPLKEETRFMFNRRAFEKMARRPVFVNMARGGVVDPDALLEALKKQQVRGAALDVTFPEPLPASHPLCHLSNCLIVPHIGSSTVECRSKMAKVAATNLLEVLLSNGN